MTSRTVLSIAAAAFTAALPASAPLRAQTTLPGIQVTTPTPVVRPAPAPQPKAAVQAPAVAPPVPTPQPAASPSEDAVGPSLPGSTILPVDSFVPVTVILAPDIAASSAATFGDLMVSRPGLAATTFAPAASRPVIRGLDSFRVRIQENGFAAHDVSALSEDHAVPIDPISASQVEVIRGPATLRYGSTAIGGVVSSVNGRIPEIVPPRGISVVTRGGWTSGSDALDGLIAVDAGAGPIALHADAWRRQAGDYRTPHGRQLNSGYESEGGAFGGSLIWPSGFIGVSYATMSSLYEIPGIEAAERKVRIDMRQERLTSRGEWRVRDYGLEAIRFWLGGSHYRHDEISFDAGVGADEIGSSFLNRELEGRVEVQHAPLAGPLGPLSGAIGVQWARRRLSATGEGGGLIAPNATDSLAAYIFEEARLGGGLRLQAAMRIERVEVDGTATLFPATLEPPPNDPETLGLRRVFIPASASVGLLQDLPYGIVARVTAQYVERAPDAAELFSKGPHEATQTFEIGDPTLVKERAATIEIGLRRAAGDVRFDVSAFYTRFHGFIFKDLTGLQCDDEFSTCGIGGGTELDQIVFRQRDATFYGLEMAGEVDVVRVGRGVVGLDGRYDFVHATFLDGTHVPRIPPHRAGLGIFWREAGWLARIGALHAFRQDRVAASQTPTNGYTLVDAELAYTFRQGGAAGVAQELTIGVKGENLLDDDVRNHVSFKRDEVLLPGRTIRVYGTMKLN